MRIRHALLLLLISCSFSTFGQNKIFFQNWSFERLFTKCEIPPKFGKDSLDLNKYFGSEIQTDQQIFTGRIKVRIDIDTSGKVCCEWIENNSNIKAINDLASTINSMPNWNCGIQNGYKVNCAGIINLVFTKN